MFRPNGPAGGANVPVNWQRNARGNQNSQMRGGGSGSDQSSMKRQAGNTNAAAAAAAAAAAGKSDSRGGGGGGGSSGGAGSGASKTAKKRKIKDRIITQQVIELVPESQAYMDLLAFENKLDSTIMRKRLDIQEALKRPIKQKRTLRFFVSTNYYPAKEEAGREAVPEWELRVEGKLIDDPDAPAPTTGKESSTKTKRKFSSFFKNLVIELDKDLYGPENHLVEWHRTPSTQETDGFQVKRAMVGKSETKCSIFFMLDYQPAQFKLSAPLSRVLGVHTQTRAVIVNALWQYIKKNQLQDPDEREYVNNDKYLKDVFNIERMKFCEIPQRLQAHMHPPDPIVINYIIDPAKMHDKKPTCYDITLELDDSLRDLMQTFLLSTNSQQELTALEGKIHETVEGINQLKVHRDFFLSFAVNPLKFMKDWLASQSMDLKVMTDTVGNPEEERKSEFYNQAWMQEAVHRYFYRQVQMKRAELEQALGIRSGST